MKGNRKYTMKGIIRKRYGEEERSMVHDIL
jgi:hypothetical protein